MKTKLLVVLVWGTGAWLDGRGAEIPFPAALDSAAVVQTEITDIDRQGLVLGNGDLIGLLWERDGTLCVRVAKNDIWDARVDTSADPPMLTVDVPNQRWTGGGHPPSYDKPYPQPRCAAVVRIGGAGAETGRWRCIRAGGKVNEFLRRDGAGAMAVEGAAGASAGYRCDLRPAQIGAYTAFKLRLAGTAGARFYVNIYGDSGKPLVESGWRDSPDAEREVTFPIEGGNNVGAVELYVMTKDGGRAENRIHHIALEGGPAPLAIEPGMLESGIRTARLDLRRAVATIEAAATAAATAPSREIRVTRVRALADRNVFLIETDGDVSLEEVKTPELPAADLGEAGGVKWLHMKLPGDQDYQGMEYALAVARGGNAASPPSGKEAPSSTERFAVSVVTSFDAPGPVRDAAIRLARETAAAELSASIARHEAEWSQYWSASGVALDDPDFELWWYRMVYYLRCFARPGVVPVGLFAGLASDNTPWHGDYHHNYNAWQPYWTPCIINHADLTDPWVRYMNEMLPRLKWLAETTYDCEGAFVGISSFAFEPDPATCRSVNRRQSAIPPYGYTLGMIGMSAQVLWFRHIYQPDVKYMEERIYPVLREAALFYASFAEKCPRDAQGKARVGPSYSPEHGGFGVANVPFDLAYARFSLRAAIAAAGELRRDADLAERFRRALELLPPYPTAPDATGQPIVVDWTGCTFRQIPEHNITVPAVPVFPAEQVTWFSPESEKELFRNTLRQTRHRGCNSTVMLSVAKARFSMLEALEDARRYYRPEVQPNGMFHWPMHGFYLSESVGLAAMISEFLLQSVDDVIRVFPCWPKDRAARFADLRAQGGFLVSAEWKPSRAVEVGIISENGRDCTILNPWPGQPVRLARQDGPVQTLTGERIAFETRPGERVRLTCAASSGFRPALARLELDRGRVCPGGTIQAIYTFRSNGPSAEDLTVFVHVVRPDGRPIGADFDPDLPTGSWPEGKFVREGPFPIGVPDDAAPGTYAVLVGLFGETSRVPLDNPGRDRGELQFFAGEFEVVAREAAPAPEPVRFDIVPVEDGSVVKAERRIEEPEPAFDSFAIADAALTVELHADRPAVKSYVHAPTRAHMAGASRKGVLTINGRAVRWEEWKIDVRRRPAGAIYRMDLPAEGIGLDLGFEVEAGSLRFRILDLRDPEKKLRTIGWKDMPLLVCEDPRHEFWRLITSGPDAGGKMWLGDRGGKVGTSPAERRPVPAIHGCIWKAGGACAAVTSNYPLFPVVHQVLRGGRYAMGLSDWQARARGRALPLLDARVVILGDENGNGRADLWDWTLWQNRRAPDADPIHRTSIAYKVFLDMPASGLMTTFAQTLEMIEAIHNVTDGIPQIIYLVGWQYTGHDTGYPSMDVVNARAGGAEGLRGLIRAAKERYGAIISYHTNIDDTYEANPGFDPALNGRNGICHALDVETGAIFRRLEAMFAVAPVEKTIHLDNLRVTNCVHGSPAGAGPISILDEIACGLGPIAEYLRARGITITTEGQNGMPIDGSPYFAGFWHADLPLAAYPLFHRKLIGGGVGSRDAGPSRWDSAVGTSIHQDASARPFDRTTIDPETWKRFFSWFGGPAGLTVSFEKEWPEMVDRIYRGSLLYHFYLEREWLSIEAIPGGARFRYSGDVTVECANDRLKVTWGDVTVALDDDRFIPRGDAIYAYSPAGGQRDWVLPERFRGKDLALFTLTRMGRGSAPDHSVQGDAIHLHLKPRTPVKITIDKESSS